MWNQTPSVQLNYGAYLEHGVIRHKPQRLRGLVECLNGLGYDVDVVPSLHIDRLSVVMKEREIFRCNIKNLYFNIDCEDDLVCKRVVAAVEEAKERMYSPKNIMLYHPLNKGKRLLQRLNIHADPSQILSSEVKLLFEMSRNYLDDMYLSYQLDYEKSNHRYGG